MFRGGTAKTKKLPRWNCNFCVGYLVRKLQWLLRTSNILSFFLLNIYLKSSHLWEFEKKSCNTEGTNNFTDNLTGLPVKKGCRSRWNAGLDSQMTYLAQHKNCMAAGYTCLLELKTGRCWTGRNSSWAGGAFCSLQCWTISFCSSRRHSNTWEKLKAVTGYQIPLSCWFFQMLPSRRGINQRAWVQTWAGSCQRESLWLPWEKGY